MIVNLNFCVKPTKIHFCNNYKRHLYVLLPTKDINNVDGKDWQRISTYMIDNMIVRYGKG